MQPTNQKVYDFVEENGPVTATRIARSLEMSLDRVYESLREMHRVGTVSGRVCQLRTTNGEDVDEILAWEA